MSSRPHAPLPWRVEKYISPSGTYRIVDANGGTVAKLANRPSSVYDARLIIEGLQKLESARHE